MKILITGGAGFAGSGLAVRLAEKGHFVTVLDFVAPSHYPPISHQRIRYLWVALQDITPGIVADYDVIVHLAAQADVPLGFDSPRWTVEQNVMGTVCLLEAIRRVWPSPHKVIIAGSGNEFGRPLYLPIDEKHPLTPHNPYAFSKAAEEMAGWTYYRCYEVPIVVMSNGACLGPGMRREIFVFRWLYAILTGNPVILEGGDQTRDLTYVTDILDAWELVINAPDHVVVGEKFQVSYGEEHSVKEILEWCFEVCEVDPKGKIRPVFHRPGEKGQRELFDNSKARRVLGYDPKVSPKEGIRLTMEWIKNDILKGGRHG